MTRALATALTDAGIRARTLKNGILAITEAGQTHRFHVFGQIRPPRPSDLPRLREKMSGTEQPLLWASYVSATVGRALVEAGYAWADKFGNWDLRAPGLRLQRRVTSKPTLAHPSVTPTTGRGLAVLRLLIQLPSEEVSTIGLAKAADVSQPRVSQVLKNLADEDLVERPSRFAWEVHHAELLEHILSSYKGPQGDTEYYYSLDSPNESAQELFQTLKDRESAFVSGDVAADLLAPHKRPEALLVYRTDIWKELPKGWTTARSANDANIIVVEPRDKSIAALPREGEFKGTTIRLADATQVIWDLIDQGGEDRLEAAEKLKTWILNRPSTS